MKDSPRVLIVEDELKIAHAIREGLTIEGYSVEISASGEDGFYRASTANPDLIVLDLMLPGRGGLEILKTLRQRGIKAPVLILTAKDTLSDRVAGLDGGADDYLVKPFAFAELLARLRALLRRGLGQTDQVTALRCGDLHIDLLSRRVERGRQLLSLTVREFALLEYLLRHQQQVVSREMITRDVWQEPARVTSLDNVIDVHITRLRKKVDLDGLPRLIHTVRGVGFTVREEPP